MAEQRRGYSMMGNLSRFHREHEKFYAQAPLHDAAKMHVISGTLKTLADRWTEVRPDKPESGNPYMGCEDLNELMTIQHDGLLFMEGEGEPSEFRRLKRDLGQLAEDFHMTGDWLSKAMENSWEVAGALVRNPGFRSALGDRHRIIVNDWLAANMSSMISRLLMRALDVLGAVDFAPEKLRADLAGPRFAPGYLYSAAELVDRAADLAAESATLVHDNEYRWRRFRMVLDAAANGVTVRESV
jgi:hypothetical protein